MRRRNGRRELATIHQDPEVCTCFHGASRCAVSQKCFESCDLENGTRAIAKHSTFYSVLSTKYPLQTMHGQSDWFKFCTTDRTYCPGSISAPQVRLRIEKQQKFCPKPRPICNRDHNRLAKETPRRKSSPPDNR